MTAVLHSSHTPHPGSLLNIHPEFLLQFCFRVVTSPATDQFFDFANVTFVCNTFATNKLNPFFGTRSCVRRRRRRRRTTGHLYPSCIFVFPVVFYFFLCLLRFSFFFVCYFVFFLFNYFYFVFAFSLFLLCYFTQKQQQSKSK